MELVAGFVIGLGSELLMGQGKGSPIPDRSACPRGRGAAGGAAVGMEAAHVQH